MAKKIFALAAVLMLAACGGGGGSDSDGDDSDSDSGDDRLTGFFLDDAVQGLIVETELDPENQAFLYDHKIEDTPVLPGVMGLEAFAELSTLLLPGYRVESIEIQIHLHYQ